MKKQLYKQINDVDIPILYHFDSDTGEIFSKLNKLPVYYSIVWPNGTPCLIAELYLTEKSKVVKSSKKDGGTLGNIAKNLTHLIKFCYKENIDPTELTHKDIDDFIDELSNEKYDDYTHIRNNDTVKKIIAYCIDFLIWLQKNIALDRRIVGLDTKRDRYQIKLVEKHSSHNGVSRTYTVFPTVLPSATKTIVKPIPTAHIKKLWDALAITKSSTKVSNKFKKRFTKQQQSDHREYMFKRRELQLVLLDATGLRPQELTTIECSTNLDNLTKSRLSIPTLKRREDSKENSRVIPISKHVAIKIELFIKIHREKLIDRLIKAKFIKSRAQIDDVIYLNAENGKEVIPDAAYQEFRRLRVKTDINQKTCQSMFRHRFITNMVKLHLIGFMDKSPLKNRQSMNENDYRTILTKVTKFTGHKLPDSLLHYIDLAWEELDVFAYTCEVKALQDKLKSIYYIVHSIKSTFSQVDTKKLNLMKDDLMQQLIEIEELSSSL